MFLPDAAANQKHGGDQFGACPQKKLQTGLVEGYKLACIKGLLARRSRDQSPRDALGNLSNALCQNSKAAFTTPEFVRPEEAMRAAPLAAVWVYLAAIAGAQSSALPSYNIYNLAGNGTAAFADSPGPMFYMPAGIGYDSSGQALYVADQANNRIRKIQFQIGPQGPQNVVVTTVAGTGQMGQGCQPGPTYTFPAPASQPAVSATVTSPTSVAADHQGNIYIA